VVIGDKLPTNTDFDRSIGSGAFRGRDGGGAMKYLLEIELLWGK
jgi:hypothetical protein